MKYLNYAIISILLYACNTTPKTDSSSSTATETSILIHPDPVYLEKNTSISPANSYSDLFLDSSNIEAYIISNNLAAEDAKNFRSFYNYRNGQFAWFNTLGFTEQAKGFWNLQDKLGYKADKRLRNTMDTLLNIDTLAVSRYDTTLAKTELALTNAFLNFYKTNRQQTSFAQISPEKMIPVKKQPLMEWADSLLEQHPDTTSSKSAAAYVQLQQKLQAYRNIARQGGWVIINGAAKPVKKSASSPLIAQLKKRLQQTGNLPSADTSGMNNDSLRFAIQQYQAQNGLKPTGLISDTLIASLKVPVEKRMEQIVINLVRMQWLPQQKDKNYISVNIPEYLLTVYEKNSKVFDMPVAVGKEGTSTTMFTGDLNQIVFSPYWNIPASIVKNEILPKMKANPDYLKSKNMEVVSQNDSLPVIRQLPGKDNSLGAVKFLFPNRYDIYFHDTNAKDIFTKDKRAVSHGCIRLQDAAKLAAYLLQNDNSWTEDKINTAMHSGKEQYVKISPAMPVVITYFTAWVDTNGQLNFRDDIYANDSKVGHMLFEIPVASSTAPVKDTVLEKLN